MVLPNKKWRTISFITFINATEFYQLYTLILSHVVLKVYFPFKTQHLTLIPNIINDDNHIMHK